MRIKRHDIPITVYDVVTTPDAEGIAKPTLTLLHVANGDVQPVTSRSTIDLYGLDGGELRKAFVDLETDIPLNSVCLIKGKHWQAVGLDSWYSHTEVVLREYKQ